MSESIETIQSWMDIFVKVNNPDQDTIEEAQEQIQDKLDNDKGFLVDVCTKILMLENSEDDKVMQSKSLSSILLSKCLEITNRSDLELLRRIFEQNPEMVERIKDAVKANIFSNNSCIRYKTAQIFSYLISILDEWKEGIEIIVNSFSNSDLLPYGYIGLISIMSEIVNHEAFSEEVIKNFECQFAQTIVFCVNILNAESSEEKFIPELRYEACKFINDIMKVYKEVFDTEEKKAGKIPALLENLQNSFDVNDLDLFNMLIQLLSTIVKQYYEQSPDFIEIIFNYVGNGFEMISINQEYVISSINFWKDVAILEKKIIEKTNIDDKLHRKHLQEPLEPLLTVTASEILIPIFLNFMENIDENDTSVEDFDKKAELYMFAYSAVYSFYKIAPQFIFEKVRERIEEINEKIENWTQLHAIMLMLYSISGKPTRPEVLEYISDKFDLMIEASLPHQAPRLRETALFVIGFVIKNYPEIIIKQEDETTDKRITDIINSIEPTLKIKEEDKSEIPNDTLIIFSRYASIICHLSNVWTNFLSESKINLYFDKFNDILECLFNLGILNCNQMLIESSSNALNVIISISTPDLSDKLGELYKKILDFLDQSLTNYLQQKICFIVQSSLCSNINSILLKLKKTNRQNCLDIIKAYSKRTLHLFYEVLSNKNFYLDNEVIYAISALINATSYPQQKFYIDLFDEITFNRLVNDFIYNGLISLNSGVIESTCILIGNLYYFLLPKIPDLLITVNSFFSLLSKIIIDHKEMKESHPFVLKAIADIFNSLNPHDEELAEFEDPLLELIEMELDVSTKLDITDDSDVSYGNNHYIYLTEVFYSYAKIYHNPNNVEKERQLFFIFDRLATYIYKLYPRISDKLYVIFAKTKRMLNENCSIRNEGILNRHSIHRIFKLGYENANTLETKRYLREQVSGPCIIF